MNLPKLRFNKSMTVPYSVDMLAMGVQSIVKYGFAFSGKKARIAAEKQTTK